MKEEKHYTQWTRKEFEATIKKVDNILNSNWNGKVKYKPFVFWKYKVADWTTPVDIKYHDEFYLKQGCFKKDTAPKINDRVKLRYRRTKNSGEIFDIRNAKIVEIINQENL